MQRANHPARSRREGRRLSAGPERRSLQREPWPLRAGCQGAFYAAVRDAIRGQAPNPVPPHEAIAVMALLELGQRSAHEGRTLATGTAPVAAAAG